MYRVRVRLPSCDVIPVAEHGQLVVAERMADNLRMMCPIPGAQVEIMED
jgi:hypothetical protein